MVCLVGVVCDYFVGSVPKIVMTCSMQASSQSPAGNPDKQ